MQDTDGLYIGDALIVPGAKVSVTLQGNDLQKPDTMQSSFSNSFALPDSLLVRETLRNSEQIDSGEQFPYQSIPAKVVDNGETVMSGILELSSFSGGWECAIYEEKRTLFDKLDRPIRSVNLERYNHPWTVEQMETRANAIDGYCYPCVDYGLLSGGVLPASTLMPAIFVHTLTSTFLLEEGYTLAGSLPNDAIYKRLILPFVEAEPVSRDEDFKTDRMARVGYDAINERYSANTFGPKYAVDRIMRYTLDSGPLEWGFSQGKKKLYNTSTWSYVCDTSMRVRVTASQAFKLVVSFGAFEVILIVEKNGQNVGQETMDFVGPYNLLNLRPDTINLSTTVDCKAGDSLRIQFIARRRTKTGGYEINIYNDPLSCYAGFEPELSLSTGDTWTLARNLPELTCLQILKTIAFIHGGFWDVNRVRREIKLIRLTDIVRNVANAVDWTDRLNTGTEPSWSPRLEPYAQTNFLKYRENEETKKAALVSGLQSLNYGDGRIYVKNSTLETETTIFELPVGASVDSPEIISGYGNPVRIETHTTSSTGISKKAAGPRILLAHLGAPVSLKTTRLKTDGITVETVNVNLRGCWFGPRPGTIMSPENRFNLCFEKVPGLKSEICLIDRNYAGLLSVLRRVRVLRVSLVLTPADIASIDFARPVRLGPITVGSLTISPAYFYLNKVEGYQSGSPCTVTLICFDPLPAS